MTGYASCSRNLLEGSGLVSSWVKEASLAVMCLWGAAFKNQGIMSSEVEKVIGSGTVRSSNFRGSQYVAFSCCPVGI